MAGSAKNVLKANTSAELLSYIINQTPELSGQIDLPVQGETIKPIGKIIMSNQRYRNAFINTINLIGLTVIKRNAYENPWKAFTDKGELNFGQQIREMILDLCNVYDYNEEFLHKDNFLKTEVPNVFNYLHELNFQKYYHTTTSEAQLRMAFENEDLFSFIDEAVSMMYTSYQYDCYQVSKYMLAIRMCDGTMTSIKINDYDNLTNRQKVSAIKNISNLMTFLSPNYNPAGVHRVTQFENQLLIINTKFQADYSTDVLATSYFRGDAELMNAQSALVDGFENFDDARLKKVLKSSYTPFTEDEKKFLANVPAVLLADDFFMNYYYAFDGASETTETSFVNPTTLENNHFLHVWRVFSTSPFANNAIFTKDDVTVTGVTVSPSKVTASAGQSVQFSADVKTTGFANKGVTWESSNDKVVINESGKAQIAADATGTATITAKSVFDDSKQGTATLTISSGAGVGG